MRYLVGGVGFEVRHPSLSRLMLPAGTLVDDSLPEWAYMVGQGPPPPDAIALDQATYQAMLGAGYGYWRIRYGPGVVPVVP
jgi:hypothetical protein